MFLFIYPFFSVPKLSKINLNQIKSNHVVITSNTYTVTVTTIRNTGLLFPFLSPSPSPLSVRSTAFSLERCFLPGSNKKLFYTAFSQRSGF